MGFISPALLLERLYKFTLSPTVHESTGLIAPCFALIFSCNTHTERDTQIHTHAHTERERERERERAIRLNETSRASLHIFWRYLYVSIINYELSWLF